MANKSGRLPADDFAAIMDRIIADVREKAIESAAFQKITISDKIEVPIPIFAEMLCMLNENIRKETEGDYCIFSFIEEAEIVDCRSCSGGLGRACANHPVYAFLKSDRGKAWITHICERVERRANNG